MSTVLDPARLASVRAATEGPAAKMRHALKHLGSMHYQARKWLKQDPYSWTNEFEKDGAWLVARLKVLNEPPEALGLLAGDLMHDLRGSLDHTVYLLARLTSDDPEGTQFPIFLDRDDYSRPRGRSPSFRETYLSGVPDEYRALIDERQPFNAPEPRTDRLAVLKAMSNADKHRVINTTYCTGARELEITPAGFRAESFEIVYPSGRRIDDGAELFRLRPSGAVVRDVDMGQIALGIDFGVEVVWGPDALTLHEVADVTFYVFRIIGTFLSFIEGETGLPYDLSLHGATPLRDPDPWRARTRSRRSRWS